MGICGEWDQAKVVATVTSMRVQAYFLTVGFVLLIGFELAPITSACLRSVSMVSYAQAQYSGASVNGSVKKLAALSYELNPDSWNSSWSFGRVLLSMGAYERAWSVLHKGVRLGLPVHYWQDLLVSGSLAGHFSDTTVSWEHVPYDILSQGVRDYVAYAYLNLGLEALLRTDKASAEHNLKTVQLLREGDLASSYYLRSLDATNASTYSEMLLTPSLLAVQPADVRLLDPFWEAMSFVDADAVLDREVLSRLLPWWIGQHPSRNLIELCITLDVDCEIDADMLPPPTINEVRLVVAEILGGSLNSISLGPDLLLPFERWQFWRFSDGSQFEDALFVSDLLSDNQAKAIGIWKKRDLTKLPTRSGYVHEVIVIPPGAYFVTTIDYKTKEVRNNEISVSFSLPGEDLFGVSGHFPATHGVWCRVFLLGQNKASSARNVRPALWLWNVGAVTWAQPELHVFYSNDPSTHPQEPRVYSQCQEEIVH